MISEWNPLSIYVKPLWYWEKNVLVQVWAKLPFNWKACNNTKKHYYEVEPVGVRSIFWKKQVMVVCMQYAKGILQVFWSINTVYSEYTHVIWDGILKVY